MGARLGELNLTLKLRRRPQAAQSSEIFRIKYAPAVALFTMNVLLRKYFSMQFLPFHGIPIPGYSIFTVRRTMFSLKFTILRNFYLLMHHILLSIYDAMEFYLLGIYRAK